MTILIIGGTGKTGVPLSQKLNDAGHSVLAASRSGSATAPVKGVKFDWLDPSTFENPFKADSNIDKIYFITPPVTDRLAPTKPFIDLAVSKGVKRFVLMSATATPAGGPATGKVHEYLAGLNGIEYASLRPSWFFENFKEVWLTSIRDKGEFVTATQDGKIPFIAVDDIVDAAFHALTDAKIEQPDLLIVGPDLLTYDQVAEIFSAALDRKITHDKRTPEGAAEFRANLGVPAELANLLVTLEGYIAEGSEEKVFAADNKHVGKLHLVDWVKQNKAVWQKA